MARRLWAYPCHDQECGGQVYQFALLLFFKYLSICPNLITNLITLSYTGLTCGMMPRLGMLERLCWWKITSSTTAPSCPLSTSTRATSRASLSLCFALIFHISIEWHPLLFSTSLPSPFIFFSRVSANDITQQRDFSVIEREY